jgi:hypothetical protein
MLRIEFLYEIFKKGIWPMSNYKNNGKFKEMVLFIYKEIFVVLYQICSNLSVFKFLTLYIELY